MKLLYDQVSFQIAKNITKKYSTSFSLGIKFLHKDLQNDIYGLYGFVRVADEIVDSFHGYDQSNLLSNFIKDTHEAIENKISNNPVLHAFQIVFHKNNIDIKLVNQFLVSMQMDLNPDKQYDQSSYKNYIVGSAEVVGLMCLKVFLEGNNKYYEDLKPYAEALGSAFQKINFLRDFKDDYELLGRVYFPEVNFNDFSNGQKKSIEDDIEKDFIKAFEGIKLLPKKSRLGVYIAYVYYHRLFQKIKKLNSIAVLNERIRVNDFRKLYLLFSCYAKDKLNLI